MSKKEIIDPNSINRLVANTEFKGDLKTDSDIKLDGRMNGTLVTKGKLVLGETGFITGDVHCKSAVISGRIEGKVFVDELIMLQSSSKIDGDMVVSKIAIEPGAVFNGNCKMGKPNNTPKGGK